MKIVIFFVITLLSVALAEIDDSAAENEFVDDLQPVLDAEKIKEEAEIAQRNYELCLSHECPWGKECSVIGDQPECVCAKSCPTVDEHDEFDFVCSTRNETFNSICDLYRERCLCRSDSKLCVNTDNRKAHLEFLGKCKALDTCTKEHLNEFPERMADWLYEVMLDLEGRGELDEQWNKMLAQAKNDDGLRRIYPVTWKFCDLDKEPHDHLINRHEMIPIIAPVMPMESCIKPFIHGCDSDGDHKISLYEWGACLGLEDEEIMERC